jgi:hypothetical protein
MPASVQALSGSVPAAMFVQVPSVPVSAHDAQVPEQLEEQQTPCWQSPEAQAVPAVQACPRGASVQVPALQMFGEVQSVSAVQLILQILLVVSQAKAPQEVPAGVAQVPVPLQVDAAV